MKNIIWMELKNNMQSLLKRFSKDYYYNLTFKRVISNLKFHQFLCEEDHLKNKIFFRTDHFLEKE